PVAVTEARRAGAGHVVVAMPVDPVPTRRTLLVAGVAVAAALVLVDASAARRAGGAALGLVARGVLVAGAGLPARAGLSAVAALPAVIGLPRALARARRGGRGWGRVGRRAGEAWICRRVGGAGLAERGRRDELHVRGPRDAGRRARMAEERRSLGQTRRGRDRERQEHRGGR